MPSLSEQNPLMLSNTMTGGKEPFVPLQAGRVKLFTCGPSIYGSPHIGNYRSFLYEDILHRYLEYLGYSVKRLINFTDVEDKAIKKAGRDMGTLHAITERAAENFYRNTGLLHIRMPDYIPRSSTSVGQAVQLIKELLDRGVAYRLDGDVFYDPLKFEGFGRLYGLDMSSWPKKKRRFRLDNYPGNRWNRGDFILWHGFRADRDGDVAWETELGRGRPAWNVQDPAMITKHLGFTIDIACGGVDNLYRHHDYNIAVIEAVSGRRFATYWLHGEHVLLDGRKISKSKGNIVYPEDLLSDDLSAACLRYALIAVHYREKLNLTGDYLKAREEECRRLQALVRELTAPPAVETGKDNPAAEEHVEGLRRAFEKEMNNDLQVGPACAALGYHLEELATNGRKRHFGPGQWKRLQSHLRRIDSVLQILFE